MNSSAGLPTLKPWQSCARFELVLHVVPWAYQPKGGMHQVAAVLLDAETLNVVSRMCWRMSATAEAEAGRTVEPKIWQVWMDLVQAGDPDAILTTGTEGTVSAGRFVQEFLTFLPLEQSLRVWMPQPVLSLPQLRAVIEAEGGFFPFAVGQVHDLVTLSAVWRAGIQSFPWPELYADQDADQLAAWLKDTLAAWKRVEEARAE